jgi:phage-related protein
MAPRRWRDYQTSSGRRPVGEFLESLSDEDAAEVVAAMAEVRQLGLQVARKLRGEIWEVRADGNRVIHRVLFAQEGRRSFILLALVGFTKKTQRTPPYVILLAEQRLADWRSRGI